MAIAAVFDCEDARLSDDERAFFREADPWGFILFARHCENPVQMRALCDELRTSVGRDAPILIDQEGGRVARMRARQYSGWNDHPPMSVFGELWKLDPAAAMRAAWLNAFLLGQMVSGCGVNVNCVPAMDIPQIDSDPVTLGDRALAAHIDIVVPLARAVLHGSAIGGALPVVKHMPGLGRALCDSHHDLPTTDARRDDLESIDFAPFKALCSDANPPPFGMTAHVVYGAYDADSCATHSNEVINEIIRRQIGFDGLLFSDDLKMEALGGDYSSRAEKALLAGCDMALACNFDLVQKQSIAADVIKLQGKANDRAVAGLSWAPDQSLIPDIPPADRNFENLVKILKPVWVPGTS